MFQKYMEKDFHSAFILLRNLYAFICWFVDSIEPQVLVRNTTPKPTRQYYIIRHHASCAEDVAFAIGGRRWSRTTVLGFSVRHTDRVCHLPIYKTQKEKIVGFEPTTFCLTDKCSTNELNFFLIEKIAVCVFNFSSPDKGQPQNLSLGAEAGFEPAISTL